MIALFYSLLGATVFSHLHLRHSTDSYKFQAFLKGTSAVGERITDSLPPLSFFSPVTQTSVRANLYNLCLTWKFPPCIASIIWIINCKVMCYERGYLIGYYQVIFPLHGLTFTASSHAHGSSDKAALWQGSYWLAVPLETPPLHCSHWQQKWHTGLLYVVKCSDKESTERHAWNVLQHFVYL